MKALAVSQIAVPSLSGNLPATTPLTRLPPPPSSDIPSPSSWEYNTRGARMAHPRFRPPPRALPPAASSRNERRSSSSSAASASPAPRLHLARRRVVLFPQPSVHQVPQPVRLRVLSPRDAREGEVRRGPQRSRRRRRQRRPSVHCGGGHPALRRKGRGFAFLLRPATWSFTPASSRRTTGRQDAVDRGAEERPPPP